MTSEGKAAEAKAVQTTAPACELDHKAPYTDDWWAELHLHAFLSLSVADRKIERRELVWVKRFFLASRRPQFYQRFLALGCERCGAESYQQALVSLTATAKTRMSASQKRQFINSLAQMCKSKGSIANEEYESILQLAEAVGLEDTDADAIINSVFSINDTFTAVLGLLAFGFILYVMRIVLVPLVIAVFIAIIIRRVDEVLAPALRLQRLRWASRLATMAALFSLLFAVLTGAVRSASELTARLPFYQAKLWSTFERLDALAAALGLDSLSSSKIAEQLHSLPLAGTLGTFVGSVVAFLGNFLLVVVFTGFLVFGSDRLMGAGQDIADRVAAYLSVKSMMSLLTGLLVMLLCWSFGIDFALFWGTLAFLLNYVPSVGAIAASVPPLLLAIVQLGDTSSILLFATLLASMHIVIGQVLEPKLMGDKLAVNPVALLLGLIFWGFLWGIPGMFLAAPLMALLRVFFSHYNFSRPLERLIAAD